MQVVVDALQYDGQPAGVGHYIAHLLAAYAGQFPEDQVTVLVLAGQSLPGTVNLPLLPAGVSSGRRLWFEQRALAPHIRRLARDVVHFPDYQRPAARLGPSVLTVHDLAALRHPEAFPPLAGHVKRTLLRRSVPRATRIIVPTHAIRAELGQLMEEMGANPDRIRVVPHGVDPPPPGPPQARPQPYLLYVGTLEPRKNLVRLLTAYDMLAQEHRDCPDLVLAGARGWLSGPIQQALERLAARTLGPQVIQLGYVSRGDLWGWLKGAVGFCYPSLYEGFGLPILEAMAAGTPVLTTAGGATGEVAGSAAILVDPLQVGDIARGLNELVYGPRPARQQRIEAGRERAAAHTWAATAAATRAVYSEAAQEI